jgi:hypothetical protein
MTQQEETISITSIQLDSLLRDTIDLISRHGCFTGSKLHEDKRDQAIELTASSYDDDQQLEVVATVYIRGERLKKIKEKSDVRSTEL